MFFKKGVFRNFRKFIVKYLCQSLLFNKDFLETPVQVFYSEFSKVSKSAFFTEHLRWLLLWFILVASFIVTWVSWPSRYRYKLEAEDFIFHTLQRNFLNIGVKIFTLWYAKSIRSFCFSLSCSQLVYTSSKLD